MTHQQTMKLAVTAKVALKTAEKWLKGGHVTEANGAALETAARKLGFKVREVEKEDV